MVIEPRGNWEHSAYQSDNQFVVEVRPVRVDPNKLTQGPGYQGEKLSLNFQNIEVRSLLQVIADFTNFNVVTSDTVTGNLTLRLKDVPWDQALDIILQAKGLGLRKSGNVIWIAPKDELAIKEQAELEAGKKKTELEPLRTQEFPAQLHQGCGRHAADLVGERSCEHGGNRRGCLSPRGSVIFEHSHQPVVRDRHPASWKKSRRDRQDRHSGAPGADRGANRRGQRHLRQVTGHQARRCGVRIAPTACITSRWAGPRDQGGGPTGGIIDSPSSIFPQSDKAAMTRRPLPCPCLTVPRLDTSIWKFLHWKQMARARSYRVRESSRQIRSRP